ncbi:site-2 protease family protein [Prochlorococcus sp. MIT 1307]|uniref:site-2 protease family protein n=1 Tax=Prochlorococcus sp. MIT 1307 TaxID=3096219 RepID=UPI002A75B850|nr:site-2 protease family protein [Prochlorococcus sp. MIT 1307]
MEGWELLRIRGIPLRVHPSWFVILILFAWTAQGQISTAIEGPLPFWFSWGLGLITSLLLFVSVLLHELGHSFVALHEGVKVRSITLFLLGGVARVERECSTAMGSLRVAIAGPLVSFFLAIVFFLSVKSANDFSPILANLFGQLGSLNLVLALFNLLPGLPLDGGVILKALVWQLTGSQRKGLQVATATGNGLSLLAIFIGTLLCFQGGGFGGLWLVILGWFGFATSRSQNQMLTLQKALTDLNVGSASGRRFRVMEEDNSLSKLSQLRLSSPDENSLPEWVLVCRLGRWVGYVNDEALKDLPVQYWEQHSLADYTKPLNDLPAVGDKDPLWRAVIALEKSVEGRLLVFNPAGLPSGTLDRVDVGAAVLKYLGLKVPKNFLEVARTQNNYPLGLALPEAVEAMLSAGLIDRSG